MAAPMELFCWAGGWGLPSVDPDCLAVLTYARFTGAPLKVHRVSSPWRSPSGKDPPPPPLPTPGRRVQDLTLPLWISPCRSTTLTTTSLLHKGQTRWPSCPCWRRSCCRCWFFFGDS
uniref:Uncharacterized protein n=1 Tax=Melopsittacus undulatus TaxID=13146 RepID=A0A8V5H1A3_MELUD